MKHDLFTDALAGNVIGGKVNYAGLDARSSLRQYWREVALAELDQEVTREQILAFYINAYNALIIRGVLAGYKTTSFFQRIRFFYLLRHRIANKTTNLYHLEHETIRPLGEPRIHFALVCSAKSCPKLLDSAYDAEAIDTQLHENAVDFINDKQKNAFNNQSKTAYLSEIFKWFAKDFTHKTSLQQNLAQFVQDERTATYLRSDRFAIEYKKYDWNLNGLR